MRVTPFGLWNGVLLPESISSFWKAEWWSAARVDGCPQPLGPWACQLWLRKQLSLLWLRFTISWNAG